MEKTIQRLNELFGKESIIYKNEIEFVKELENNNLEKNLYLFESNVLVGLVIRGSLLTYFPDELNNYKKLRILVLSGGKIKKIKRLRLESLETIDLSGNQITVLENKCFPNQLKRLFLDNNKIKNINNKLSNLHNLHTLILDRNRIQVVPVEIFKLKDLDKVNQRLREFRDKKEDFIKRQLFEQAAQMREEERSLMNSIGYGLSLKKNPIILPVPEILFTSNSQSTNHFNKILAYLSSLSKSQSIVNEAKVILLGEGGSGKTSILKLLCGESFNENETQTHGINIKVQNFKNDSRDIKLNFWDFGGQQIMHSTHQFFLSQRCLYIVVIDCRKDNNIEYWIKHVQSFGGTSPVLIVMNKTDENPGFDLNKPFLREKYPNIIGFVRTSCLKNDGIDELQKMIIRSLEKLEILRSYWNPNWISVKDQLETQSSDYISISDYVTICNENNLDQSHVPILLELLHDLGIILHFDDLSLNETNVLNPHWVTEGVYKIINSKILSDQKGLLNTHEISNILDNLLYPVSKHHFIVSLMLKFELCYRLDEETYLVPDLLTVEQPKYYFEPEIESYFDFSFLPKSVFPRLMVRLHKEVKEQKSWRTGMYIEGNIWEAEALIIEDIEEKKIFVSVKGNNKRIYYSIIRNIIIDLIVSFKNIQVDERLILDRGQEISVSYQHLLNVEKLGIKEFVPEGGLSTINVKEALGSIQEPKNEFEKQILKQLELLVNQISGDPRDESNSEIINKILILKPNFFGLGVDFNEAYKSFFRKKTKHNKV